MRDKLRTRTQIVKMSLLISLSEFSDNIPRLNPHICKMASYKKNKPCFHQIVGVDKNSYSKNSLTKAKVYQPSPIVPILNFLSMYDVRNACIRFNTFNA